ncbi:MAG: DUF3618 domain-containing protein [Clostridia bacterium]|nr:DUF3618 domain-containing protein [Clostridia bacterium]
MSKLLESIWYDYVSQQPAEVSAEMQALREELGRTSDALWGDLSNTQKEAFLAFESCMNSMSGVSEKDAFVRGVRFAVMFLLSVVRD